MSNAESKFSRRVILRGAGAVALVGLGSTSLGWPAFAAANDKYPEEAFKQKSDADAIKSLYGKTAEASDKIKLYYESTANGWKVETALEELGLPYEVPVVSFSSCSLSLSSISLFFSRSLSSLLFCFLFFSFLSSTRFPFFLTSFL